jgi:hypothetical protein
VPPTVELEEARSGAAGRQALWHAVRLTWHGQKWAGSGSRMQRGSTVGLPGVAGRSWPCPPLDLLRSPAGGVESTRFPKCVLPLSLPFFSALRDRHRTWMGTWRRSVSMCPCRCGSERARHGRMAGTRAESQHRRRSDGKELFTRPPSSDIAVRKVTLLTLLRSVGRRRPGRRSFRGRQVHRGLIGGRRRWGRHPRALW